MKKYDSYKPSGIEWIGEIPSHWEIIRMRYLCDIITGDKDTINREDDGLYPFYVRSPQVERINTYSFDGEAVLMAGDGVGAGKVLHYVNGKFDFHQRVYNFHNFRHIKGILLYCYLKSLFRYKIEEGGAKNTVDSVRQPWLKDFPVCIPPIEEQTSIVDFIENKSADMDKSIAKRQRSIELLEELKQSVITQTVTRCLKPNVPLKDSGINWIGKIPTHWERLRIKNTAIGDKCCFIDGDWIESKDITSDGIKYLTSGNIGARIYKEQGSGYISDETFEKLNCKEVYPGDILISRLNEPISRACIIPDLQSKIVTCVDNVIYRPNKDKFDYGFIVYILNNYYYSEYANLIARGATMHRIGRLTLGGISIPVPPLAEQQAIADYLDKKCAEIDSKIAKEKQKIELLQELKQSIITEVVTGKRKVV